MPDTQRKTDGVPPNFEQSDTEINYGNRKTTAATGSYEVDRGWGHEDVYTGITSKHHEPKVEL